MSRDTIDATQDVLYDIVINKDRTLKETYECYFIDDDTEVEFDFGSYTGATLNVKKQPRSSQIVLDFNTEDGSIVLSGAGNTFQLNKSADDLATLQVGTYEYDMYLISEEYPKRAFLSGKFIIKDRITQ